MKKYGCVGRNLKHSFSKEIHAKLADYEYELIELNEEEITPFFDKRDFAAVNVTIPYKQTVMRYLDSASPIAERIGAVNTVVNKNGKLYGYNTDYHGMKSLIEKAGIEFSGKKVLILGTGGTSKTAGVLASDLGAAEILKVSRSKTGPHLTYEEAVSEHSDANVIINTTPLGMYPDCDSKPIDISFFKLLEGVVDAVYNPLYTNLVLDARRKGIKAETGLYMLVMQAVAAVEKFLDIEIQKEVAERAFTSTLSSKENIVLGGISGSENREVGRLLDIEGFEFIDTDEEIESRCGCSTKELITTKGEKYLRDFESEVIRDISSTGCRIISVGGDAVLIVENLNRLRRNGKLFFINADLNRPQASLDRPLSDNCEKPAKSHVERIDIYKSIADVAVPDTLTPEAKAEYIINKRMELIL